MPSDIKAVVIAKQRLTRHLNDVKHILADCEKYREGWVFPTARKELYVFIRTQRSIVSSVISKLEMKVETIATIYGNAVDAIAKDEFTEEGMSNEPKGDFEAYWEDREGHRTIENVYELIQSLEMRLTELDMQEMQVSYSDEFDNIERRRTDNIEGTEPGFAQTSAFTSFGGAQASHPSHTIPAHWYKRELRIPDFNGNPTEFEAFWEIFSELVHKQPYSDIEKLTILLDKCKGEAARALKFIPRKGSCYNDAVKQLQEQFHNQDMNVKLLLDQLEKIPQSTEDAFHLRATVNDLMAIITPLSRAEKHIDAIEYKTKVWQKFPQSIQKQLLSKEYDESANWTMEKLLTEIRNIVKKQEVTQVHATKTPQTLPKASLFFAQTLPEASYSRDANISVNIASTAQADYTSEAEEVVHLNSVGINMDSPSRLMVTKLILCNPISQEKEQVHAILDTGATRSFISTALANRLNLPSSQESFYMITTFGGKQERQQSRKVTAHAVGINGDRLPVTLLTSNIIMGKIILPRLSETDINHAMRNKKESYNLLNSSDIEIVPDLLLGIDYYNDIVSSTEPSVRLPSGLFAVPTFFGHVVTGSEHCSANSKGWISCGSYMTFTNPEDTAPDLSVMWALENFGITEPLSESEENRKILQQFHDTIEIRDNEIFVKFPWKFNKMDLDDNYRVALSRLHQLYRSLNGKRDLWSAYCKIIGEQLERNIIEDVPQTSNNGDCPTYYIPHQAVIKPTSTTTKHGCSFKGYGLKVMTGTNNFRKQTQILGGPSALMLRVFRNPLNVAFARYKRMQNMSYAHL
ncbi:Tas retrotransposon peptidase A16 [Ancylostoma ceylanicum]|uniref:Tas retrotransposon peptidase A16 n=1 Tax=Ancylostoma ceylanicum TaxID=53326 RepID=A0A0D6LZE6_9BILA|nr:Tas retrotransposon peptidase A16 [Ancylostoma ceylanicum]